MNTPPMLGWNREFRITIGVNARTREDADRYYDEFQAVFEKALGDYPFTISQVLL